MSQSSRPSHTQPHNLAASLPKALPDARIRYGDDSPVQFADLRLPTNDAPEYGHPVVVFIHGGGWLADWTKDYSAPFVEALTDVGFATWDIEFRRMGNSGGGYPEMFRDVAKAADHLQHVSTIYPLDITRVVAMGHSSGGHLALWLAGRANLDLNAPLYMPNPHRFRGVVSIGGVNDLEHSLEHGGRNDILRMLGSISASEAKHLFAHTSPARLLPLGLRQVLILGTEEALWRREMTHAYAETARLTGDDVLLIEPQGLDHFDVVDPHGPAFADIAEATKKLVETG